MAATSQPAPWLQMWLCAVGRLPVAAATARIQQACLEVAAASAAAAGAAAVPPFAPVPRAPSPHGAAASTCGIHPPHTEQLAKVLTARTRLCLAPAAAGGPAGRAVLQRSTSARRRFRHGAAARPALPGYAHGAAAYSGEPRCSASRRCAHRWSRHTPSPQARRHEHSVAQLRRMLSPLTRPHDEDVAVQQHCSCSYASTLPLLLPLLSNKAAGLTVPNQQ
eukprot:366250-Chlamydomonas_euryale.AAC.6